MGRFMQQSAYIRMTQRAARRDIPTLTRWLTEEPKVKALGEIGSDYYYDLSPRDVQKEVFVRQLELAYTLKKPVILHIRDAHGDT